MMRSVGLKIGYRISIGRVKSLPYAILGTMLPIVVVISASVGAFAISPLEALSILLHQLGLDGFTTFTSGQESVLLFVRLPRVVIAMGIGGALAIAGAGIQGLFRNPLADPALIGTSSGAALASSVAILSGWHLGQGIFGLYGMTIATFAGAFASTVLVFRIASNTSRTDVTTMLLAGIAINALAGALMGLLIYLADDDQLRSITFWTLGSLGGANWTVTLCILPLLALPIWQIPKLAKQLDAFALGENQAECLGIDIQKLKTQIICWATLAVGASVAAAGIIGFVGLVIPHIARQFFGAPNEHVSKGSVLMGAIVLSLADMLCRTVVAPSELPIGILTALLGTPIFLWLLIEQKKGGRHA